MRIGTNARTAISPKRVRKIAALIELDRRGALPPKYAPVLGELRRRGIVPSEATTTAPELGPLDALRRGVGENVYAPIESAVNLLPYGSEVRSGVQRGLRTTADFVADAATRPFRMLGAQIPTGGFMRQGVERGLVRPPESTAGRYVQGTTAGIAGALPLLPLSPVAPAVEMMSSGLAGFGSELGRTYGGEGGALLGGLLGGMAAPGAVATARGGMRGGARGRAALDENLAAFERSGIRPMAGQVTASKPVMVGERLLSHTPGGNVARRPVLEQQSAQAFDRVRSLVDELSGARNPTAAGGAVQRGVRQFADDFRARSDELYRRVDDLIPETTTGRLDRFRSAIEDIQGRAPETSALREAVRSDAVKRLASALDETPKRVSYDAMREFRTTLGTLMTGGGALTTDLPRADLKRLYGALQDDIKDALADSPTALKAQQRADRYYRAGMRRIEQTLDPLIGKADRPKPPERVLKAVENMYKTPSELARLKRSMPRADWDEVAGYTIGQLGRATPGRQDAAGDVFSFETFLTNWNRLPDGAKRHLFGTRHKRDLDAFAKVAELIRNEGSHAANPSGTGLALTGAGSFAWALYDMATAGAFTGGTWAATKLLSSRPFMSWLTQATKIPIGQFPAHISRLEDAVKRMEPEERDAVRDLIEYLNTPDFPSA